MTEPTGGAPGSFQAVWTPELLMREAIAKTRLGMAAGQSPFGCAIAVDDNLVACEHNTVVASPDATAHAEVNAIRAACLFLKSHHLTGAIVATTCEPCPMCMAALHWARVKDVYYGATIADAASAGFNELHVSAASLLKEGGSSVRLHADLLRDECRELFQNWLKNAQRQAY